MRSVTALPEAMIFFIASGSVHRSVRHPSLPSQTQCSLLGRPGEELLPHRHVHLEPGEHRAPLAAVARDPDRVANAGGLAFPRTEDPAHLVFVRTVQVRRPTTVERVPGDARAALVHLEAALLADGEAEGRVARRDAVDRPIDVSRPELAIDRQDLVRDRPDRAIARHAPMLV